MARTPWRYAARRAIHEFGRKDGTDIAATLTYHAILALFPAVIALLSLVGIFGQRGASVDAITTVLSDAGAEQLAAGIEPTLRTLSATSGAGIALVLGFLGALWASSSYVDAFGRAMNRMYDVPEGRPVWKRRPAMLLIALVLLVLVAAVLLVLIISGPITHAIGNWIGASSIVVTIWQIAKWPVLLLVVIGIVSILYFATPNVKHEKFRWLSAGAVVAIVVWLIASAAFGFYVINFSNYNKTYGALAGAIIFLVWLWISNLALVFGGALDNEVERSKQLHAGIAAEETLQLPARDTHATIRAAEKHQDDVRQARALRDATFRPPANERHIDTGAGGLGENPHVPDEAVRGGSSATLP